MGCCGQADGISLFIRIDPSLSTQINFDITGHKIQKKNDFSHCSAENRNLIHSENGRCNKYYTFQLF